MNRMRTRMGWLLAGVLAMPVAAGVSSAPTAITYQGRLTLSGSPVNGTADLQFTLWNSLTAGAQVGPTVALNNATLTDGLLTASLDFGAGAFNGRARWIQIAVRTPAGAGAFTTLTPRQPATPAPMALSLPGLYTAPTASTPNVIGGSDDNVMAANVVAGTICGGGSTTLGLNVVTDDFGFVGGGFNNRAGDNAGGSSNRTRATVVGGNNNVASGSEAFVGGGSNNQATGDRSTVSGGNVNAASGFDATVPGGRLCVAQGFRSFAAGNQAKALHNGSFVWADDVNVDFQSTATNQFRARAGNGFEFIITNGKFSIVPAGPNASGDSCPNVMLANSLSSIAAGVVGGFVVGGASPGFPNLVADDFCTVAGGADNIAGSNDGVPNASFSTVGGGRGNTASGFDSTVPGGLGNVASGRQSFAAGAGAEAVHHHSFVWADFPQGFITVPPFQSNDLRTFSVRCTGGARFVTAVNSSGTPTTGVTLPAGGGAWAPLSDRNMKANFNAIDPRDILDRLSRIPISEWNYISQDRSIRHLGPMAQDFHQAFGLGEDNLHITTVDADGIALAAIQGLHQIVLEREQVIARQQADIDGLRARIDRLERLMSDTMSSTEGANP